MAIENKINDAVIAMEEKNLEQYTFMEQRIQDMVTALQIEMQAVLASMDIKIDKIHNKTAALKTDIAQSIEEKISRHNTLLSSELRTAYDRQSKDINDTRKLLIKYSQRR